MGLVSPLPGRSHSRLGTRPGALWVAPFRPAKLAIQASRSLVKCTWLVRFVGLLPTVKSANEMAEITVTRSVTTCSALGH